MAEEARFFALEERSDELDELDEDELARPLPPPPPPVRSMAFSAPRRRRCARLTWPAYATLSRLILLTLPLHNLSILKNRFYEAVGSFSYR